MTHKFSPSSLSLLKECPRCFFLHFNKNIKRPASIFPSLPSGMDRILKIHFDSFIGKGIPPELKIKNVKLFDDLKLLEIWRNNFKGISYTDSSGNILRGAVDNILVKGKKLIVLDYKTRGFPLKEDTAAHYQNQLDIYNFLLRKNLYKTEDYAYLLFYHPDKVSSKGDVVFNTDLVKMKIDVTNAEKILANALKVLSSDIPEASEECGYCEWVKENKF
ncbi:MAG TPA: PD-(D/E)XK nuclease family protein [Candidatus Nanoarchaeia archaeon]|nr:PD-(D/E)XK nuclease family protein [Candidatus Nanoarchaeia archaeon]